MPTAIITVAPKRKTQIMKIGCSRDSNGNIGIAAGSAFDPNFIITSATTGSISANDLTWRNNFPLKEHVVQLVPYTTGGFGNVLIRSAFPLYDLTPDADIFCADSLDVSPSGTSFVSTYHLFTLVDATALLEKTIEIAQKRNDKSASFPLDNSEIFIWADLLETGQIDRARSFISAFITTGSVIRSNLLSANQVSDLPGDYQVYLSQYRQKVNLLKYSDVDYINFNLSSISTDSQIRELPFFCQYWQAFYRKPLVALSGGALIVANSSISYRTKEILQIVKDGGFKYVRMSLNTTSGILGMGTSTGGLTSMGLLAKEFKENQ